MVQPEIRFNGFNDEWVEKKLGDVSNLMQGAAWKSSEYLETGPNLLITISNLKSAIVDTSFGNRLAEVSLDLQNKYGIANNDVLVSMTGNVGRVSIYKDCIGAPKALLNQRVGKVIPVNIDNLFLYAILRNELFERKMIDKGQGAAQLNISSKDIQQFPIQLPTLPEQQKIGSLFSKYDAIIGLREQKLEELNALKKGLLQQMFPKDGAKVPELRFAGFADEWEERKLKDVLNISKTKNKTQKYGKVDVLSVSREVGTVNQIKYQGRSFAGSDLSNYKVVQGGELIYTKSPLKGAPYGIFQVATIKGILSPLYAVYTSTDKAYTPFVATALKNDNIATHYLAPLVTKGAKNTINVTDEGALEGKIQFPSILEQKQIFIFFKQLDDTIALHQRKLDLLKEQKQGLLQRML